MLYQKHRPKCLADICGQPLAVKQLSGFIESGSIPHVIGFCGPPGTGKTSLAHIMAECVGAKEINVIYRNCAQSNGIDDIRQLSEATRHKPLGGGAYAIVMDEFHALTKPAFQALLKPLEYTNSFVWYFLCTSMPEKIDKAIRSRISMVKLDAISNADVAEYVSKVAEAEKYQLSNETIEKVVETAKGSMRTALVNLEKLLAADGDLSVLDGDDLSSSMAADLRSLCQAMLFQNSSSSHLTIVEQVAKMTEEDLEPARWMVLNYTAAVLKNPAKRDIGIKVIKAFENPFFNSKKAGFLAAALSVLR